MLPGAITKQEFTQQKEDLKDKSIVCYWCEIDST